MKSRTVAILAVVAVVLVAAAVVVDSRSPAFTSAEGGGLLFPGFEAKINDAARIIVATADHKIVVARNGKGWVVASKFDYPAKFDTVKQALVGLARERTIEAKTALPSLYSRLQVGDVTAKGAQAAEITVEDAKGAKLASLILGKPGVNQGANGPQQIYVRKPGDPQSWLAEGPLARTDDWKSWAMADLTSIEANRIHSVTVTQTGDTPYVLTKAKPSDDNFTLENVPADKKVNDPYQLNEIAGELAFLKLDDVMPAKDLKPDTKVAGTLAYHTFDGLTIDLTRYDQGGKSWFAIKAAYDAKDAAPAPAAGAKDKPTAATEKAAAVKQEAATLNSRTEGWLYTLNSGVASSLSKKLADLVVAKTPAKKGS